MRKIQIINFDADVCSLPIDDQVDIVVRGLGPRVGSGDRVSQDAGLFSHVVSLSSDRGKSSLHDDTLAAHFRHLSIDKRKSTYCRYDTHDSYNSQYDTDPESSFIVTILGWGRNDPYIRFNVLIMFGLEIWATAVFWNSGRRSGKG